MNSARYLPMQASALRNFLFVAAIFGLTIALVLPLRAEQISLEVQSASVERDKTTNEMVVTIELSPEAKTAFANFTQRNTGKSMEIRLGTTVLLRARLVEKIEGGIIRANTKFSEDEAKNVAAQLKRGTLIILEDADS